MQLPRQQSSELSIGLTPLIDVVFILLIFFMLVTNFDGLRLIDLSVTSGKSSSAAPQKKSVIVLVTAKGECLYQKTAYPCSSVRREVENSLSISFASADQPVNFYLKPGKTTRLQNMLDAIDALSASGIQNVLLAEGNQ